MTIFTLVRHGETEGTRGDYFTGGQTDSPLTDTGLMGTTQYVQSLPKDKFEACITSTMQRAKFIGTEFRRHFDLPVFHDRRLIEKDAGVFEGCHADDFRKLGEEEKHVGRWFTGLPDGESHRDVALRVIRALAFWTTRFSGHVLIGCHTDVIRAVDSLYKTQIKCEEERNEAAARGELMPPLFNAFSAGLPEFPSDEALTAPIPYFHEVEIDFSIFPRSYHALGDS